MTLPSPEPELSSPQTPLGSQHQPSDGSGAAQGNVWQPATGGPPASPTVSLPKGGGAIRDIGEKFSVNAATGTASLTVPVVASPGRLGFGPSVSLSYDSGSGNGPFGLGWKVSLPAISRKTDKGLPRYLDDPDQDTFVLSGAEDLVPVREERDGAWAQVPEQRTARGRQYAIQRYRPRIEGLFARIERWRDLDSGDTHWRSITSTNITTVYGATADSRISDPDNAQRVFSWLICATYDDTGNAIAYDYTAEDSSDVDTRLASERNRTDLSRSAGRYPKRVRYGNRVPLLATDCHPVPGSTEDPDWMFELVFDYGDHEGDAPLPEPTRVWPCRPDPFSTYRPGFEVRTYRRCHRLLMLHHFPDEPGVGAECLVGSTDLTYRSTGGGGMTIVASITHTGYRRLPDGQYRTASLPPLEFDYGQAVISQNPADLGAETLQNLPSGIDGAAFQLVDLDGDGLSGILARRPDAWYYKANLGGGRFAAARVLATHPASAAGAGRQELLDLDGSGHLDLVEMGSPLAGFYQRTDEGAWASFRPFVSYPNIAWDDPDLRMVDLDGDGLADVLITGDEAFVWYPSLGLEGFGEGRRTFQPWDEEQGPRVIFADPEQTIYLADMTGDGLSDLVRVRNGEVCYWPSVGFGRFGAKVTMDHSPWMDQPGHFDQRRVRLADVDGSGTSDLVYLHPDGARLYLNQSGNGYTDPHQLCQGFPRVDSLTQVMVTDLLGRGTACLVWSSPLPGDAGRQIRYLDLMANGKPYLLTEVVNNLGAQTRISYAASTEFYLADKAAGQPWITRLPFPVQVVARTETIDRVNRNKFTTRYAYHHGYYDGIEREFRGFGMVEKWDAEDLAVLEADTTEYANIDQATSLPPMLTKTWLHTGVFPDENWVSMQYAHEYWRQPGSGDPDLPDCALPKTLRLTGLPPRPWRLSQTEAREACRALKGMPLREEVYALDGAEPETRPYMVTEHNYTIELLQPAITPVPAGPQNYHAVLVTHPRESMNAHYERVLYPVNGKLRADPRITHDLVLAVDDYGNPLHSASAAYGRLYADSSLTSDDQAAQARLRLTSTDDTYTNAVELPDTHRTPMPAQTRIFEVVGLTPTGRLFGFAELRNKLADISTELPFQDWNADPDQLPAPAHRLTSHTSVQYLRDDLSGALPPGVIESMALPYRSYRQAFTDSLIADLYGEHVDAETLRVAGYHQDNDLWLLPSGRVFYSPNHEDDPATELEYARQHFFQPQRFTDPFGHTTTVSYDRYDLLVAQTSDPLGNLITAGERDPAGRVTTRGLDYRVLAPSLVSDPNRNRTAVAFDALGRVSGTAVMGKPEEQLGDSLAGFEPDPPTALTEMYFADPFGHGHQLLGPATTRILYNLDSYRRSHSEQPAGVAALARETHTNDLAPGQQPAIQRAFSYSDGFGREIQHKGQAEAGPVTEEGPAVQNRWIASGWTVFNNKGQPVRQYEPFFTATPAFEFARAEGVSPVLFYDPPGRVVATLNPDASYAKTKFDPWGQDVWDAADTSLLDPREDPDVRGYAGRYLAMLTEQPGGWVTWHARRTAGQLGRPAQRAAEQTAEFADTPTRSWLDTLGRTFLTVAQNRIVDDGRTVGQFCRTRTVLDIQGNEHAVLDALSRTVMRYDFAMVGGQISREGMDTGGSQALHDVLGKTVYARNSRGFVLQTEYDALRRPVRTHVTGPGIAGTAIDGRTEYGESVVDAEARNLRTRVVRQFDGAGITTNSAYDFKGNLLGSTRQLPVEYATAVINWASSVPLEERIYTTSTTYDALNRPISTTTPDDSVQLFSYNQASLLDRLDARLRGAAETTTFANRIEHNARAQRTLIQYGNGTSTAYTYDPLTFRVTRIVTLRDSKRLQDLRYTYDAVGNPTQVSDHAQSQSFFRNRAVGPSARYTYDALYRLIEATGREHLGQSARIPHPVPPSATDTPPCHLPHPNDQAAIARYTERYNYDEAGNLLLVRHRSTDPSYGGWTRAYHYDEQSLLEPNRYNNRLTGTGPANAPSLPQQLRYDEQGNITSTPGVPQMRWDYVDRLHATAKHAASDEGLTPRETTYYVYDAAGQRTRKVTQRAETAAATTKKSERIYIGAFEIYRKYNQSGAATLERETLHILDDNRWLALAETRTLGTDPGLGELVRYQLANDLDSTVLELDQNAQMISYEEYYPYGSTSYRAVRSQTETPKRYRYTGKERDEESGLYYYGARYYAPWLGRWVSCDPVFRADKSNLYAYVGNNPIGYNDPTGKDAAAAADILWKGVKGAGGAEAIGGGPEDPIADVAAGAILVGAVFYAGWTLFKGPEPTRPRPAPPVWTPPPAAPPPPPEPAPAPRPPSAPPVAPPVAPPLAPPVAPPVAPPTTPVSPPTTPLAPPLAPPRPAPPPSGPRNDPRNKGRGRSQPDPKRQPRVTPEPADPPPSRDEPALYVVRLQAQGGGLEKSVILSGMTPITVAQGIAGLAELRGKLTRKQADERAEPFRRAERFIRNAPAGGGIGPPGKSFALPRSDIRVDVEIKRGINFRQ